MRRPSQFRIGAALILAGAAWFGAWAWWASTLIRVPLDIPISLAPGHIRTPQFRINGKSNYWIVVAYQGDASKLNLSWTLSQLDHVIAKGSFDSDNVRYYSDPKTVNHEIGAFDADKGQYRLDLDVLEDDSRGRISPELAVFEYGNAGVRAEEQRLNALACFLFLAVIESYMIVRWAVHRRLDKRAALERAYPLTERGPMAPLNRKGPSLAAKAPRLSFFSLILVNTLVLLWCVVVVGFHLEHYQPHGLIVRLLTSRVTTAAVPGIQPLRIRITVEKRGMPPLPYMDSRFIPWEEFSSVLEKEIRRRPYYWPVYLDGDRDLEWKSVAQAIDIIRGLHTEVILLTSHSR